MPGATERPGKLSLALNRQQPICPSPISVRAIANPSNRVSICLNSRCLSVRESRSSRGLLAFCEERAFPSGVLGPVACSQARWRSADSRSFWRCSGVSVDFNCFRRPALTRLGLGAGFFCVAIRASPCACPVFRSTRFFGEAWLSAACRSSLPVVRLRCDLDPRASRQPSRPPPGLSAQAASSGNPPRPTQTDGTRVLVTL